MVGLMGGMLSNTFWKAVGGDPSSGELTRGHAMGTFHASRPPIFRNSVNRNVCQRDNTPLYVKSDHLCDALGCGPTQDLGPNDLTKQRCLGDVRSSQEETDGDWVMFDLSLPRTMPSIRTGGGRSALAFSSSVTSATVSNPSPKTVSAVPEMDNDLHENDPDLDVLNTSGFSKDLFPSEYPIRDIYKRVRSEIPTRMSVSPEINENLNRPPVEGRPLRAETELIVRKKKQKSSATCIDNNVTSFPTTPGNCGSGEGEEAWPHQCALSRHSGSFSTWCSNRKFCHASVMASSTNMKESDSGTVSLVRVSGQESLLPPEPPPVSSNPDEKITDAENTCVQSTTISGGAATATGCSDGSGGAFVKSGMQTASTGRSPPFIGYREDIRAYDIYQITPHISTEAHYSRLPAALPPLTDSSSSSDSDPDDARKRQGLRKRKRKIPSRREGEKRQREGESEEESNEDGSLGLENVTVYTSPYLEDYTNRIAVLQRVTERDEKSSSSKDRGSQHSQRRVSFSFGTSDPSSPSSSPSTFSTPPRNSTTTYAPSPLQSSSSSSKNSSGSSLRRGCDDNDEGDVNMKDEDDEDDDEASTVVPDDFEDDDTDSDIEILTQSESWVDLSNQPEESPDRVTPLPFGNGEEYIRLLREAQKESNHSSARVSLASSRRDTPRDSPHDSPRSPPNSPNTELTTDPEEAVPRGVYINYYNKEGDFVSVEKNTETDWIWDWSSRPDQTPPKEWRFSHPGKGVTRGASIRRVMVGKSSLFSRDVLYTLLITNVLSLLIGTGIGIWLSKRSSSGAIVTLPIN